MTDDVLSDLDDVLAREDLRWSLMLVGEDQSDKLAALNADLRAAPSATGDGKRITPGFEYWGIGPSIAWARATRDPLYPVMKLGIEYFRRHWRQLAPDVVADCVHLVSLGVGTGVKDHVVLRDMVRHAPEAIYIPVDLSAEMLRMGTREAVADLRIPPSQVLPVQLDLAFAENADDLARAVQQLVADEPVLYTLTGNTLANFDDDEEFLASLAAMLRPQDRLLLEVATTTRLDDQAARDAAAEYESAHRFGEFVISALRYLTDLKISEENVRFHGSVDGDGLLVKVVWHNDGPDVRMGLPDASDTSVPTGDTVRLYTTRKFSRARIQRLLTACGLGEVASVRSQFRGARRVNPFGIEMLLLAPDAPAADGS